MHKKNIEMKMRALNYKSNNGHEAKLYCECNCGEYPPLSEISEFIA